MNKDVNPYDVLKRREIYNVLIGDTAFGEYVYSDYSSDKDLIHMPYLKGSDLCNLSTSYGLPVTYDSHFGSSVRPQNLSRWQYMENLLKFMIEENRCSALLTDLLSLEHFKKYQSWPKHSDEAVEEAYPEILKTVLAGINELLSHSGNEIIKVGDKYVVKNISEEIKIDASAIKTVNHDYIQSIYTRGLDDIDKANYDSALTKSRTLMEEAMCYAIEKKGVKPNGSGKIRALYDQFTENYMLHTNQGMRDRMDDFIKKAYDLMESVSVMRDIDGDSHGEGKKRINLEKHQTLLYFNVAIALADFVLSVAKDG